MPKSPHFTILGFPVRIEPWFWLSAILVGSRMRDLRLFILWMVIVATSVLVHELGHALAYRRYDVESAISLHGMGGSTQPMGSGRMTRKRHIVVSFAGPVTTMVVFGIPTWIARSMLEPLSYWPSTTLYYLFWVNVIWALVNLAPVWPMDGGKILDDSLFEITGRDHRRAVHLWSLAASTAVILWAYGRSESWLMFLFIWFFVINASALMQRGETLAWPSWSPEGGGVQTRPSRTKRIGRQRTPTITSAELVRRGFKLLQGGDLRRALIVAEGLRPAGDPQSAELELWVHALDGRLARAAQIADETEAGGPLFDAIRVMESGSDLEGIRQMASALVALPETPSSHAAVRWIERSGHLGHVIRELLDEHGPRGDEMVERIQHALEVFGAVGTAKNIAEIRSEVARPSE